MTPRSRTLLPEAVGRRLTLTPIGLDVVAALSQDPAGMRLSPLAHVIDAPVSSVQAVLRSLSGTGLVAKDEATPPRYRLAAHPAREALIRLALLLPEPVHVLSVVLRASPAVAFAAVDRDGFVAALEPTTAETAVDRLRASLAEVAAARDHAPPVQLIQGEDLARLVAVSVGSRARLASAIPLKGRFEPAAERSRVASDAAAPVVRG